MNEQIAQLSQILDVTNHGHILYIYDKLDRYVRNAVAFIKTGITFGGHVFIIDNKDKYDRIYQELQKTLTRGEWSCIHYIDIDDFYGLNGEFHSETTFHHFEKIIKPFQEKQIPIRIWSNVEWNEQDDKLIDFENKVDECVYSNKVVSVCAYNGKQISASLENHLCRNHDYFMTDYQLVKSILYKKRPVLFPSLSEQTEHKKIVEQLRATKHQLNSFIMHNLDPILILDMEDKIITVNQAFERTFGWSAAEVLGLNANEMPYIPNDRKFEVNRNRSFLLLGENLEGYESIRKTKAGTIVNVMMSCFPLWEEEDKVAGWAVMIRDITEQKQAQEVLIRTEKLSIAGELAASIAHEIRNPITTVKGFLQLLQTGTTEKWNYYSLMSSEIDRIELILSELLMLAKPQVSHFQQKNVSLLIQDVVSLLIPQANMNNVLIVTEFDSDEVMINCEENQLKQAFINFIKNAIDSMPQGGKVVIQMESSGKVELLIRIIDQGYGIPEHILPKLGQPFYTTKEKGTGLGLMVSKKIIENHQGSIAIYSKEKIGTTIEVKIPLNL
jgi:PAS domain S-box-containing protein